MAEKGQGGDQSLPVADQEDRAKLREFILQLREFMQEVVDLLPKDNDYRTALAGLAPNFDLMLAQLDQPAIDDYLRLAGLTGAALQLKLLGWREARDAFRLPGSSRAQAARIAFRFANIILGSLASRLLGFDPIMEFSGALKAWLDLVELRALTTGAEPAAQPEEPETRAPRRRAKHYDL